MFTGIVEEVGTVTALTWPDRGADARLTVEGPLVTSDARLGDSIAVAGVCLTVAGLPGDGTFTADVMPETLSRSTLGELAAGAGVNLERALGIGGRYGGHVVQGHVDGVGEVRERAGGERWEDLTVGIDPVLARYVAEKGSIAVSGVSLTVTWVADDAFGVSLIPTTLAATTLGAAVPGTKLNLEVDVLAKYTERLLTAVAR
ncbi:MAG TPA: riboflavin synthase [Cellulomonas sp.]